MKRMRAFSALAAAAALVLGGCSSPTPDDGKLSIVVGLYPYAYLAQTIAGQYADIDNLTQPGAEPHDLELTARQVVAVSEADLIVYESTLQPAVDAAVEETHPAHALDVTTVVPLEDHDIGEGISQADPHIWLDPLRMTQIAEAILQQLLTIDPVHGDVYTSTTNSLLEDLNHLDTAYSSELAHCEHTAFITTHAAFGYLAERYGLTQIAISGMSPDAEPSPDRIIDIQRITEQEHLTTVFFETLVSPDLAQTLADDMHLRTDVLDPLEGVTSQSRGTDYISIMESNLTALKEANGCQ